MTTDLSATDDLATRLQKAMLTAHATTSVGWLGVMLALPLVGLTSHQAPTVRGVYLVSGVEIRTCVTAG